MVSFAQQLVQIEFLNVTITEPMLVMMCSLDLPRLKKNSGNKIHTMLISTWDHIFVHVRMGLNFGVICMMITVKASNCEIGSAFLIYRKTVGMVMKLTSKMLQPPLSKQVWLCMSTYQIL